MAIKAIATVLGVSPSNSPDEPATTITLQFPDSINPGPITIRTSSSSLIAAFSIGAMVAIYMPQSGAELTAIEAAVTINPLDTEV